MQEIVITRPDDWHLHLRDGDALAAVLGHTGAQFARAIVMPNLKPPVTTVAAAAAYRQRILDAAAATLPSGTHFEPLMTLYLTDRTRADEIRRAADSGFVKAVKLYPAGATTNSDAGVSDLSHCDEALSEMARCGMPLLVHGEVTDPAVDIFDREAVFLESVLAPVIARHPSLKVVVEHITTGEAVDFVLAGGPRLAATITAHHLLYNRNAIFLGGVRPHWYCLPVLKRETHRQALLAAATGGNPKFFLGTDSAPHSRGAKEASCGCAGCYTAHAAMALYAEAFAAAGALDKLEAFASFHGPDFYGLPRNGGRLRLVRESWTVPADYAFGGSRLVPLRAGEKLDWNIVP